VRMNSMREPKDIRKRTAVTVIAFFFLLLGLIQTSAAARKSSGKETRAKGKVVYVCSCLKTQSCSCMTEAKTEGPCSCGTAGGPPMKAVPSNSAWAKANRRALAE
jgi:hypothetical protein